MPKKKLLLIIISSIALAGIAFVVYVYTAPKAPQGHSAALTLLPASQRPSSIKINFATCSRGSDTVGFSAGSTILSVYGLHGTTCRFTISTEFEMSSYVRTTCNVPTSFGQREFMIADDGIQWGNTLQGYCQS